MDKYIYDLTEDDVKNIYELCFKQEDPIVRIYLPRPNTDNTFPPYILAATEKGSEFQIKTFQICPTYNSKLQEDGQNLFLAYMTQKFGNDYLFDAVYQKKSLQMLEKELREIQQKVNEAKEKASADLNNIKFLLSTRDEFLPFQQITRQLKK